MMRMLLLLSSLETWSPSPLHQVLVELLAALHVALEHAVLDTLPVHRERLALLLAEAAERLVS